MRKLPDLSVFSTPFDAGMQNRPADPDVTLTLDHSGSVRLPVRG